jgi:hypothetical protein
MGQKVCRATSIFVTSSRCLFLPFCLYLRGAAFRASRCYHSRVVKSSPLQSSSNYPRLQCTMAESLSDQQLRNRNDPFTLVSPELITNVICQLPSLFDALVFSATSRTFIHILRLRLSRADAMRATCSLIRAVLLQTLECYLCTTFHSCYETVVGWRKRLTNSIAILSAE